MRIDNALASLHLESLASQTDSGLLAALTETPYPHSQATSAEGMWLANQPAMVLPFNPAAGLSDERRRSLDRHAQALIDATSDRDVTVSDGFPVGNLRSLPQLDYRDIGQILKDIAGNSSLGEQEKAYVWTQIANHKLTAGLDRPDAWYVTSNEGAPASVIDSNRPVDSPGHAFVGFDDSYHCRMAMLPTMADSRDAIRRHEETEGGGVVRAIFGFNTGDYNASVNTVEALRAYRDGGFAAFADAWNRGFVAR